MRIFVHDIVKEKIRTTSRYIQANFGKNARMNFRHEIAHVSNSIDDADARLLFRMTSGQLFKQYTDDIPEWAMPILK